ncbi:bifunctional 3-(3-hydroxy-phenyl)propionate/3-hydroxycinnamic acid hydroxylase MhpA [Rugamonas apoptosis]|uniref:Bifunctional 3-(3-hydroxy-phenyl)propionate/3-hydroxycinnamic acid hydroxylase n=1 Tax=Rugamonas apoptosis TaxID=2758570 RepID=A0A7W2FE00_9BURK|nr:bifunctional 3-(3-hydroxy-phenyl)propionate/3-hydroxycinnamic acid hydroxylase [Rugamonas apoptosis]MBA5689894.1 bifunctional 3-(3-hydroxy-phenyl)propionate/3-hydroxycinnamic acid hydroxylase [Rugamonas apoptosis]
MNPDTDTTGEYDVVISGLGPTGLTLAHLLGQRGRRVLILEREPEFYGNARAVYTDDECMRIFQAASLGQELAEDMLLDMPFQWVLPDGTVLNQYRDLARPYGWPICNLFYQPFLEEKMAALLARYPSVHLRRGREVSRSLQDDQGVQVFHLASLSQHYSKPAPTPGVTALPQPGEQQVRGKYFVACEGGRSVTRTQLGIQMTGQSFPNPWLVVDIKENPGEDGLRHLPYFNFYCDPACPTVSCRQPNGHHRFEFMLMPGQSKEYMEDPATVRHYLSRYIDVDKVTILRRLVYTFNALTAQEWRRDRVFLAGDAAHMTPQFIGQGMNAGVRDAYNLAWKLDAVLAGKAGDQLLDTYQRERQPHAQSMIDMSVLMKDFVSVANPFKAMLRNGAVRLIQRTPGLRKLLREARFKPQPVYRQGCYFGLARRKRGGPEGRLTPQPTVLTRNGKPLLLDAVTGHGYALIGASVDPRSHLKPADLQLLDALGTSYVALYPHGGRPQGNVARSSPAGLVELEDLSGQGIAWFERSGIGMGAVALVRPDKFTFGMVHAMAAGQLIAGLRAQLGQPDRADVREAA